MLLGGVFCMFSLFKACTGENHGLSQGLYSLSELWVEDMGGWPRQCCTNNMLVYDAWMQMTKPRSQTCQVCETKGVLHATKLRGWDWMFHFEVHSLLPKGCVWSGWSSPWSDVWCSVMTASFLLCSVQILILKVQTNKQSLRGIADSIAGKKPRTPCFDFPCFSEKWRRWGWNGGLEREECLNSWSSSHLFNICAAGKAGLYTV